MAWWKAQCESRTNPKFAEAGATAAWVWYCANCWSREHLTDGSVPKRMLPSLVPGMSARQVAAAVERLITAKLAHAGTDGGFTIHDFLAHHPSKQKVEADRRADSDRKRPLLEMDSERNNSGNEMDSEGPRTRAGASDSEDSSIAVPTKPHPIKDLLTLHRDLFMKINNGEQPAKYDGGDAKAAQTIIDGNGIPRAHAIVRQAFLSTDKFIANSGRSMKFIASTTVQNKLISELAGSNTAGDGFDGLRDFVRG